MIPVIPSSLLQVMFAMIIILTRIFLDDDEAQNGALCGVAIGGTLLFNVLIGG